MINKLNAYEEFSLIKKLLNLSDIGDFTDIIIKLESFFLIFINKFLYL